ncbi:hypothetical protein FHX09_004985 [Rhizobium sp. BK538]|nr:hypothetical protein [Rhizobium sp. BK060]MBB4171099.1 hypothetical protein [Rhizobium sp. BK538]TCM70077.1 hypothetical protein EV291_12594 [Rhizobium sp. BK068]
MEQSARHKPPCPRGANVTVPIPGTPEITWPPIFTEAVPEPA